MSSEQHSLQLRIKEDVKNAMRARDKARLNTLRLITAAIKQREVDERITLDDTQVTALLDKLTKQRRESIQQFQQANRVDLVEQEQYELDLIKTYLPEALDDAAIAAIISEAIGETAASSIKDMGKVMAIIKPKLQGRADMAQVSQQVKQQLS